MSSSSLDSLGSGDRRSSERLSCKDGTLCRVTNVLDQSRAEAGTWNLSTGGACIVLESQQAPGARLAVELFATRREGGVLLWLTVVHSDICCPSTLDMWLTGGAFSKEVPETELEPFVAR
jgi:hypothetical protein